MNLGFFGRICAGIAAVIGASAVGYAIKRTADSRAQAREIAAAARAKKETNTEEEKK